MQERFEARARPNAITDWPTIAGRLTGRRLAVFLDYDGTLTPIVARPELAVLDEAMRDTLRRLSARWPTHIVSGRAVDDVQRLVAIDSLWYAGSHGFDIVGPQGAIRKQLAPELEPLIHEVAAELRRSTGGIAGALVEDKRFSVAVHYRLVAAEHVPRIERAVDEISERRPELRRTRGKKVLELRPTFDWDKGKALLWLRDAAGASEAFPIYVGDDETDEDAFTVVAEQGIGILVSERPRPTRAGYSLSGTREVRELLERLVVLGDGATDE